MNGQMKRYEKSLQATPRYDSSRLRRIQIDYHRMIAYAKEKGVPVSELTEEEMNQFIVNSNMTEIKKLRREAVLT